MAFARLSSRSPEAVEKRAEISFLSDLKGALRDVVSKLQDREKLTQGEAAIRLGMDPGFLSRTLSADCHGNSKTLLQVMHRAGGEWVISWRPSSPEMGLVGGASFGASPVAGSSGSVHSVEWAARLATARRTETSTPNHVQHQKAGPVPEMA
jgi:hypothetical protein